jgi:hypothetical protein
MDQVTGVDPCGVGQYLERDANVPTARDHSGVQVFGQVVSPDVVGVGEALDEGDGGLILPRSR